MFVLYIFTNHGHVESLGTKKHWVRVLKKGCFVFEQHFFFTQSTAGKCLDAKNIQFDQMEWSLTVVCCLEAAVPPHPLAYV